MVNKHLFSVMLLFAGQFVFGQVKNDWKELELPVYWTVNIEKGRVAGDKTGGAKGKLIFHKMHGDSIDIKIEFFVFERTVSDSIGMMKISKANCSSKKSSNTHELEANEPQFSSMVSKQYFYYLPCENPAINELENTLDLRIAIQKVLDKQEIIRFIPAN